MSFLNSPMEVDSNDSTSLNDLRSSVNQNTSEYFFRFLKTLEYDPLEQIINEKYPVGDKQEMTLLINASLNGHYEIVDYLLKKYNVNVNDTGIVTHFGTLVDGATALWCAAGSGYFNIVKLLIENGAIVDYCTKTKSTPLRAACYLGKLNIVSYLYEHGADVNLTNVFNSTCLMIASFRGHVNVVNYLIRKGADINKQTNCGATAMHFAAQANKLIVVKELHYHKAKQLKNHQSMTPILVAAERTHSDIVNYLMTNLSLSREEEITVLELIGASYLNDKDTYNSEEGFSLLLKAMQLRWDKSPIIPKPQNIKIEAYGNQAECQNLEHLFSIKNNIEALHYESLLIRERILGQNNQDLLQAIIYRGAVYADAHNFTPCVKLWSHAMKIAQNNNFGVFKDLLRFTQVFCQMIKDNIYIEFSDLKNVLEVTFEELKTNQLKLSTVNSAEEKEGIEEEYFGNILSTLGLIIITSISFKQDPNAENPLRGDLYKIIVEIIKLNLRTKDNQTLLHLCLNYDTNVDNIFTTGICCFPNYFTMKLLIYCGADVNATDNDLNTPLHYICKFVKDFPHIPHHNDTLDTQKMVIELLNAGAHTDYVNKYRVCPHTDFLKIILNSFNDGPRSLKCLSARALNCKVSRDFYKDQLPQKLLEFTKMH